MIQNCDGERFLGRASQDGELANPTPFDAIPLGIETFWSDICQCYLWQVSGIAGAHTHIVRFLQNGANGGFTLIPGGEFGSEIGKISRISQTSGFIVEVRDSDVSGKRRTLERFRFDGRKFVKLNDGHRPVAASRKLKTIIYAASWSWRRNAEGFFQTRQSASNGQ